MILYFFCITETTFDFLLKYVQGFLTDVSQMSIFSLSSKILMQLLELQWETNWGAVQVQEQIILLFHFPFSVYFPEINTFLSSGIAT